jgi:small subunit ribosomal protein S2
VIALVDTCCDPTPIDYVIPANDDAAKSIALIIDVIRQAVSEGLEERKMEKDKEVVMESSEDDNDAPAKRSRTRRQRIDEDKAPVKEAAPAQKEASPVKEEAPAKKEEAPVKEEKPAKEEAPVKEEKPAKEEAPAKKEEAPAKEEEAPVKEDASEDVPEDKKSE